MTAGRRGAPLVVAAVALLAGCRVDEQMFQARIFDCDKSIPDPGCGADRDGRAMTCYAASQLDGTDFCASMCEETMSVGDKTTAGDVVCVAGEAQLQTCDPNVPGVCGESLRCLRTDVVSDEGVCMKMNPCDEDSDCKDPIHATCAATFLKDVYADNHELHADHLYCLQRGCQGSGSSCKPGQSCLPELVPAAAHAPDICVPNCGSDDSCPPNHFCFSAISGSGSPHICIPGLLGFVCTSDIDCLVGTCQNDHGPPGLDLNLCTVPCESNDDCTKWDSDQGKFSCIGHRCATPNAYRGASCRTDDDCTRDQGTFCVFSSKPSLPSDEGTCSSLCGDGSGPDMACGSRGGFGQVCLQFTVDRDGNKKHACYPGFFGYPYFCTSDDECVDDLKCLDTANGRHCTVSCSSDVECQSNRWTRGGSTCLVVGNRGVCAPPTPPAPAPLSAEMM